MAKRVRGSIQRHNQRPYFGVERIGGMLHLRCDVLFLVGVICEICLYGSFALQCCSRLKGMTLNIIR